MTVHIVAMIGGKEEHFYTTAGFDECASDVQYSPYHEKPPRLLRVKNDNNRDVLISSSVIIKMSEDE